jgi:hypothetical protein
MLATGHDAAVDLHGDGGAAQAQAGHQIGDGADGVKLPFFAIDQQLHYNASSVQRSRPYAGKPLLPMTV